MTLSTVAIAPTASAAGSNTTLSPSVDLSSTAAASAPSSGPGKSSARALCSTVVAKNEARCFALVKERDGVVPMSPAPTGLSPADVQDAYQITAGGGAGHTIAVVVAYGAPTAKADLEHYRAQFGLPPLADGQFKQVNQRGGTVLPAGDTGWAGEAALDVDAITAIAPAANIVMVNADSANFTDLGEAVNQAVAQGAEVVNNSYGTGYNSTPGSGEDETLLPVDEQFYNHPGVAIVASSGDSDYGVSFPASSNHVTSVGGTALVRDTSARGWTESVWHNTYGGPGSGCSIVFDKLPAQTDTGCAKRTVADVSAVADPETGLSVYYTYAGGQWSQYGGTSLSSPLVSAMYALAGKPAADSYPNAYPYAKPAAFFDVTTGLNGTCTPSYLCTAGPGYDGPTGLGTPNGVAGFAIGPHGTVKGAVTDKASGDPIAGATVTVTDSATGTTAADGTYTVEVEPGTYSVTFAAYGYLSVTKANVVVADGATVTASAALVKAAVHSVTGRVTDGSGHGYPLYSRLDVAGMPGGPVYTDPYDGSYSLDLPQGGTFQVTYTSLIPGYLPVTKTVKVGSADRIVNTVLKVDPAANNVPGYTTKQTGAVQGFDAATAPAGWTVTDNADVPGWVFTDVGKRGNLTGGTGGFAMVDSDKSGTGKTQDTYLTSPKFDLTKATGPTLEFDTLFKKYQTSNGVVEYSADGGTTWAEAWNAHSLDQSGHVRIALPATVKTANVEVRFHYTGKFGYYWEVDNVFVGDRKAVPTHGGLLAGVVKDANTGDYVKGAKVTSDADATITATTGPTGDPAVGDGYYWLFSPLTGAQPFTASKGGYASATASPNVKANLSVRQDFTLKAGQVSVSPTEINKTVKWGQTATQQVTLTNTGGLPATVKVGEGAGGFVLQAKQGAPKQTVKAAVFSGSAKAKAKAAAQSHAKPAAAPGEVGPSADAWTSIANFPTIVQDSSAAFGNGKLYSVGGFNGTDDTNNLYAYDPQAASWSALAPATDKREAGAAAFAAGKLVWTGGWGPTGAPDGKTEIYDTAGDSWTVGAANPKPHSAAGKAVLGSKIYLIGGCDTSTCGSTDVQVYDAAADSWASAAAYPQDVAWQACGALDAKIYCAGGNAAASTTKAYVYDPAGDSWSPIADLPADLWGSFSTAANGQLLVSGGVVDDSAAITNTGYSYDPASDAWSALPNLNTALYRGSGALGFYAVGGNAGGSLTPPVNKVQLLAGYDQGGSADVPWLSEDPTELTLAPGASGVVTVTLNAADPSVAQPGTYTAAVTLATDTPYQLADIPVSMTVSPPATWGKVAGRVTTGASVPVPGATVELDSWAGSTTLTTDADGKYAIWIDKRNNPVTAIVAKDGFKPQTATIKVVAGQTVTKNWVLVKK